MPPKKKTANGKNGKEKSQKRSSVVSEGQDDAGTPQSDESKSVDEYEGLDVHQGSRRGSKLDARRRTLAGGPPAGIEAEALELQDMKDRRLKLERTTTVLNKHDFVVQKLIMKAREDLVIFFFSSLISDLNPISFTPLSSFLV